MAAREPIHSSVFSPLLWQRRKDFFLRPPAGFRVLLGYGFGPANVASSVPGAGIGLAIVQKAIQRLNGNVGVESTPDLGSRFWFELSLDPLLQPSNLRHERMANGDLVRQLETNRPEL